MLAPSLSVACWLALVSLCLPLAASAAKAQSNTGNVVSIAGTTGASLRLQSVTTIRAGRFIPNFEAPIVARSASGKFLIVDFEKTQIGVFGRTGQLERVFGREGGGPGEFRSISAILRYRGDSILVLDGRRRNATILDPDARKAVRTFNVPSHVSAETIGGALVVSAGFDDETRVGYPLHLLSSSGVWRRTLGLPVEKYDEQKRLLRYRILAVNAEGSSLVASEVTQYRFTLYDSTLREMNVFARSLPWFAAHDRDLWERGTLLPRPLVLGVKLVGQERAIVALARPRTTTPQRLSGSEDGRERPGDRGIGMLDYQDTFQTVFERLDLRERRVDAFVSLAGLVGSVVGSPYWWRVQGSPDGEPRLDVFELVR
jgi:hypothetical protein